MAFFYGNRKIGQARAKTAAAQSIPNTGFTVIVFGTEDYDDGNNYNAATGEYTCPFTGRLQVEASAFFTASTYAGSERVSTVTYKNGAQIAALGAQYQIAAGITSVSGSGSTTIPVVAGDVITILVANSRTAGATTLLNNDTTNWVAFSYV